ncbi:Forkhead box protein N3 [Myotis brandtii]|uniref:Forkhead box protein N3 n=1 Tax=Myotis brandtii TaxID=109478 RepID=S7N1I0_MYOBR|nr:Forkhead box protein N3 [Myotis brandtii]
MGPVMPPSKKPESSGISVSRGLSQCYRGSGFSKALQEDDDLDFSLPDIRLEEGAMEDEELTNLNWLHESKNLLKSFGESVLRSVSPVQDLDDDTPPSPAHSDMPYDARQNPNCKPPYSFSCLIFMAIEDSPTKRLPVKDIYNWILEHFPYFANAPTGWKNSVRHNLSLNKCFKKVDKERSQHFMSEQRPCPFAGLLFEEEDSPAALESQDQLELAGSSGHQPLLTGQVSEWHSGPKSGGFGWTKRFRTVLGLRSGSGIKIHHTHHRFLFPFVSDNPLDELMRRKEDLRGVSGAQSRTALLRPASRKETRSSAVR